MIKVVVIMILAVLVSFFSLYAMDKMTGWKCTENGCERTLGGDYSSLDLCSNSCKLHTTEAEEAPPMKYSCTDNNQCVATEQGQYDTIGDCSINCPKQSYSYVQPYYYPQSMIIPSYYYPRRMWWGGGGRRRHRRPRRRP